MKFVLLFAFFLSLTSCSSVGTKNDKFCSVLNTFSQKISAGETRTLTFGRGGHWMVDHYTFCDGSVQDDATRSFCEWVSKNTSSEFMEANINRAISCLQSQTINGYLGNTGVYTWSGKISFYRTMAIPDAEVTLEYEKVTPGTSDESFMKISIKK